MKAILRLFPLIVLLSLTACGNFGAVTSGPNPFAITPSRAPSILTATPIFLAPTTSATLPPPPSLTPSITITPTNTEAAPTLVTNTPTTPTETPTPSSTTLPPSTTNPASLTILGCDTGLDVLNGLGEVTNAYIILANHSDNDLTNACLTLSAVDEGSPHPEKIVCVPLLASNYQVTLKLTVDTTSNTATLIQVALTSDQFSLPTDPAAVCQAIGANLPPASSLGIPVPIP